MMRIGIVGALSAAIALASASTFAAPPARADAPAIGHPSAASRSRAGTEREAARYRAREVASPEARKYRGGDGVVVIGASTVTVVLAVVLLVVLL